MTTRSRGPMPPPAPPPAGWRQGNEHGHGGQVEPTWPPAAGTVPHRPAVPDPRYAAAPPDHADAAQYRYPEPQHGYEAPPPAPSHQPSPSLSQLAANMRTADAAQRYQDPPQQPRYGHQGHAAYATPPATRPVRAAPPAMPAMPPRADELRGAQYDDWQRQSDPASYDLGNYGRPAPPPPPPPHDPRQPGWQGGRIEDPDYEPHAQRPADRGAPARYAEQAQDPRDQDYADDEYEDEPKRGGRRWLIVAALVGSIGLGGALAYVYKSYVLDKANGRTPVVKASQQPSRTAPESPGGKQFANQDSKVLGKLEQDSGRGDVDASGVRRVQTIPFGRDGSVTAPPAAPVLPPNNRPSVPGMTIVDGFPSGGGAAPAPRAAPLPPPAPPVAEVAPSRTVIPPPPPPPPAARAAPPPPPPAAVARVNPPVTPSAEPPAAVKRAPPKVADAAGTAAAAPKTTSGYVAVLTTRRSRMDALRSFADMQQKYPILQDKVPDVIEADLSSRNLGTMYRLVVGPPGPRQQVSALCSQLKAAGYSDCWATLY